MNVWLAEKAGSPVDREVYGIFSSVERARKVCQGVANEYFGARNTRPLGWLGDDGFSSASYHNPAVGQYYFMVTRFTVDEEVEV